jgi:hypothetical protein
LAFRAMRSVRRNKNPCLSSLGGLGIGRARQKYVLDRITLYHFTPLRFSIKHADGLCPGDGEFFLAIPIRCHANLQNTLVFCIKAPRKCFGTHTQKKFKNWVLNLFSKERSRRPVFNPACGMKNMKPKNRPHCQKSSSNILHHMSAYLALGAQFCLYHLSYTTPLIN